MVSLQVFSLYARKHYEAEITDSPNMNDPFHGINALAEGPADGLTRLKELISSHIYGLGGVAQQYKHTVRNQALQWIDIWPWFQDKENKVVEVWSEFWLYRPDGNLQWHIKIIWGMLR